MVTFKKLTEHLRNSKPMSKTEKYLIALIIGIVLIFIGIIRSEIKNETPNEKAERINRLAIEECTKYEGQQSQDCFNWYYSFIEDRE